MSQVELARRIGCDRRAVQMWEKGEHGISRTNLDQLTRVLDVTETYLAGRGKARTSQEVHMQRLEDKVDQLQAKVDELLAALHSAQERST
jgi:transcriptional regulator with XRE-family HTH domain